MIVITVARKPLSVGLSVARNALLHGTGGINIDGTRISLSSEERGPSVVRREAAMKSGKAGSYTSGMPDSVAHPMGKIGANPDSAKALGFFVQDRPGEHLGRWPANLILQHLPRCRCLGQAKVKGNRTDTRPIGDGGREDRSQWRFRPTDATKRGYSDDSGQETINSWDCTEGCPVAALDQQSGERPSTMAGRLPTNAIIDNPGKCQSHMFDNFHSGNSRSGIGAGAGKVYADTGGASRFFKVFGASGVNESWPTLTLK